MTARNQLKIGDRIVVKDYGLLELVPEIDDCEGCVFLDKDGYQCLDPMYLNCGLGHFIVVRRSDGDSK